LGDLVAWLHIRKYIVTGFAKSMTGFDTLVTVDKIMIDCSETRTNGMGDL